MKIKPIALCIFLTTGIAVHAQSIETINKTLTTSFSRINYWSNYDSESASDSLGDANNTFEQELLKYTASVPATISNPFKNLVDSNLRIHTSEDGLFRIYSWDDMTGGTMRSFYNVFQYKVGNKTYSTNLQVYDSTAEFNMLPLYLQVNDLKIGDKMFYVTQNVSIGSSALASYTIKIFAIENEKLNDSVKLIKTRSGLHNELSYEVDWSATANRESELPREAGACNYDPNTKIISIPLIQSDGKVTTKRILYKFTGQYFEKTK